MQIWAKIFKVTKKVERKSIWFSTRELYEGKYSHFLEYILKIETSLILEKNKMF